MFKGHSGNTHNDAADSLAKAGTTLPLPALFSANDFCNIPVPVPSLPVSGFPKVATDLPESNTSPTAESKPKRNETYQCNHRDRSFKRQLQDGILDRLVECSSDSGAFWKLYKRLRYPGMSPSLVSLAELVTTFIPRLNPPKVVPDAMRRSLQAECDLCKSRSRSQESIFPTLNERITEYDIELAKAHLFLSKPSQSTGVDGATYSWLLELDNSILCELLNACVDSNGVPTAWLTTLIAAVRKKGKRDFTNPKEYRAIGLESCILKFLTLIIHMKLSDAAETAGIIPPSQNGFRENHRTNNNVFVLRALIEETRGKGETLFVAFVDISNAFPSTNQHRLWNKLYDYGMTGRYFDWLKNLYEQMSYAVVQDGELSEHFHALCGVLMGDPASPTLWNLFLASLELNVDPDDASLCGVPISHLEHADDIAIISRTAHGLQRHLHELEDWCGTNFLSLDASKSVVMIFGLLPHPLPRIHIAEATLEVKDKWPYVGVWLQSTTRDIFACHYNTKLGAAIGSAKSVLGCERLVGRARIPPHIGRMLYMSLVECHLTHASDVAVDVEETSFGPLCDTQKRLLRRILGLPNNSIITPLFTELDILPLRTRRLELNLRFLSYAVSLPPSELVSLALQTSSNLRATGKSSWLMDVDWAIRNLPGSQLRLPALTHLTPLSIKHLIDGIHTATLQRMDADIDTMHKLRLLQHRLEPSEDGSAVAHTIYLRHYLLLIKNFRHCHSLTRLLCGTLTPSVFRASPGKCSLSQGQLAGNLTCRRCNSPFETPEHVLLQCIGTPALTALRNTFRQRYSSSNPFMHPNHSLSDGDALRLLKRYIFSWNDVLPIAKFIHEAIQLWSESVCDRHIHYGSDDDEEL